MKAASRLLTATYVPAVVVLGAVSAGSALNHIPLGTYTQDPAAQAGAHPMTGVLSNLGALVWGASAAISLFGGILMYRTARPRAGRFLVCSALLTAWLLLDDFFLVHDYFVPRYLGTGELPVFGFLAVVTGSYLLAFRRTILAHDYRLLAAALAFFAISIAFDTVFQRWFFWRMGTWIYLPEDGAKFLGIASWCAYHVQVAYRYLTSHVLVAAAPARVATLARVGVRVADRRFGVLAPRRSASRIAR